MTGHPISAGGAVLAVGGLATALGTGAGLISAAVALVGAYVALRNNARTARREYEQEIAAAKKDGADAKEAELRPEINGLRDDLTSARQDARDWRAEALRRPGAGS